jgi:hypothetical protein
VSCSCVSSKHSSTCRALKPVQQSRFPSRAFMSDPETEFPATQDAIMIRRLKTRETKNCHAVYMYALTYEQTPPKKSNLFDNCPGTSFSSAKVSATYKL